MKNCLLVLNLLILLKGSFSLFDNDTSFLKGILSEIGSLITNGTVEHFFGCQSQDHFTVDDIAYYLYTRNSENRTTLTLNNLCDLDPTQDVKILFAGWAQTAHDPIILALKQAYLTRYDCNVITVEYVNFTNTQYTQAYCDVIKGAEMIGDFLCDMYNEGYLDFDKVHMIGLSLGGQIIGLIGQRVQKACNRKVDRLTGLDPAGPIYQSQDISMRLDKSDANFVDVIHTNMGMFGYYGSMGHVDFFPNCGTAQPGCIITDNALDIVSSILYFIGCSHGRSILLFIESVYGPVFNSTSCSSCPETKGKCLMADVFNPMFEIMGEDCPRNPHARRFYIKTNSKAPFEIA